MKNPKPPRWFPKLLKEVMGVCTIGITCMLKKQNNFITGTG